MLATGRDAGRRKRARSRRVVLYTGLGRRIKEQATHPGRGLSSARRSDAALAIGLRLTFRAGRIFVIYQRIQC